MNKQDKAIVYGFAIFGVLFAIVMSMIFIFKEEKPREVYNKDKSLAAQAWKDAKTYSWHEYKVSQFTGDGITLERALVPVKPELTVIPLTACTEEQKNLKEGEIVRFEHFEESLNPD